MATDTPDISEHEKSLEQQIAEANTIDRFLEEPAVKAAFQRVGDKYYADFLAASTPEQLTLAKARADAIRSLAAEFRVLIDRKAGAEMELQRTNPKRGTKK